MKATVIQIRKNGLYNTILLQAPGIARKAKPGQFVEVLIQGEGAPFWRRPFSICMAGEDRIQLLVKTVGAGTALLAQLGKGDTVDVNGPFGNAFRFTGKKPVLLVGGGFGVAPLYFLAEQLRRNGRPVEALIGGRQCQDLLLRQEMQRLGVAVFCSTNDGSFGIRGLVTRVLEERLKRMQEKPVLAAAGPYAMLKAVAGVARAYGLSAQVSMEELMACGMGVCNGCVIKVKGKYQRVCKDGTVFLADEVDWE